MSLFPDTVRDLLRLGANIELTQGTWFPDTLREFAQLAKASGAQLTIDIGAINLFPDTIRDLANLGGNNVTFRL